MSVTVQMKATEQNFPVVLPVYHADEILKCDCSNESYWAMLSCGTV